MGDSGVEVEQRWLWGYIAFSYAVAVIGCFTCLLILKQRTSAYGLRNLLYLLAASIAFGAVGTFSMHFIGMEALQLIDPHTGTPLPVVYLPIPTAFSLLVVCCMAFVGFGVAGDPLQQQWWRYVVGGLAGAGGVLVMHFLGMSAMCMQASLTFSVAWVAGGVLIGVAVLSVGLLVFFRVRLYWQHNNVVLCACSLLLGLGVCGVHYFGMQSAVYHWVDDPPPQLHTLPSSDVVLGVTVGLAAVTVLVTLVLLGVRWVAVWRREKAKVKCLIINAVVLDPTASLVLTTAHLTLPSVVIEPQYAGQGRFDHRNSDFLRMLKASSHFDDRGDYTKFLDNLLTRGSLSPYSLALHRKFLEAAAELARTCQLDLSQLGLLYWKPTGNFVTMVMQADEVTADRIVKTTDLRFLPPAEVHPYLRVIGEGTGVQPQQWVELILDYHIKTRIDLSPIPSDTALTPLPAPTPGEKHGRSLSLRHSLFGQAKVAPLDLPLGPHPPHPIPLDLTVGPAGDAADSPATPSAGPPSEPESPTGTTVYLGLLYIRVAPTGLHVMVPADGPYWSLPMVPLYTSARPDPRLTTEQSDYLQAMHRRRAGTTSAPPVGGVMPLTSRFRSVKSMRRMSSQDSVTRDEAELPKSAGDAGEDGEVSDITPVDSSSPERPAEDPSLHLNLQARRVLQARESVASRGSLGTPGRGSVARTDGIAELEGLLKVGMAGLQRMVGGYELAMEVVHWDMVPVQGEGGPLMLPVVVTKMGAMAEGVGGEEEALGGRVRWVALPTFEVLQTRAGVKPGWVRDVLRETSAKGEWDREGSKGLRPTSSILPISSRPVRANSISEMSSSRGR